MKQKFQIDQKVMVIRNEGDNSAESTVGSIGVVVEVRKINDIIYYGLEGSTPDIDTFFFTENELEEVIT